MEAVDEGAGAACEDWGGVRVAFLMAAAAEYRAALRRRIRPFRIHVGPVEAGVRTAMVVAFEAPDLVVSLGSAGSARLEQGRVYQASTVSYRDMDASPLGFARGETPFLGLPASLSIPLRLPELPLASLSTGGAIVSGDAYATIDADMVDMESYAVTRACMLANVPLLCLRGISDGAEPIAGMEDWTRYLDVVDERLAAQLDRLRDVLEAGGLAALRGG